MVYTSSTNAIDGYANLCIYLALEYAAMGIGPRAGFLLVDCLFSFYGFRRSAQRYSATTTLRSKQQSETNLLRKDVQDLPPGSKIGFGLCSFWLYLVRASLTLRLVVVDHEINLSVAGQVYSASCRGQGFPVAWECPKGVDSAFLSTGGVEMYQFSPSVADHDS